MGSLPTSPLAVMLRVIQLTDIVLTLAIFITMSVSCLSGLCLSASLPLVTSQARLESDVLEPQPGVTAGFILCFGAPGDGRAPVSLITLLHSLCP